MQKRRYVLVGIVVAMLVFSTATSLGGSFNVGNKNAETRVSNLESRGAKLEVTTDNSVYDPSETVTIYLTNVGDEILYGGGPLITIYNEAEEIVFEEAVYCWHELEPGEYTTWTWDQKDQQGQQVTDGVYTVEGSLFGVGETFVDSSIFAITNEQYVVLFDGISGNGCYISCVTITILWDSEIIAEVNCWVDGEGGTYTEPIEICEDGDHFVEYWSIDWEGNEESHNTVIFCIDQTPPTGWVGWEAFQYPPIYGSWYVTFICNAADETSGMDRVEMYINDELFETITGPGWSIYEFTIEWFSAYKDDMFKFVFYDLAGNSALELLPGTDIESYLSTQQSSSTPSSQNTMSVIPSTGSMVFNNDTTPPVTTPSLDPTMPDGDNAWYVSDVTITLEASDDMSGVNATYYQVNNGAWETYTEPFVIQSDGHCLVEFYSVDNAGNVEDVKSFEIKIDQTKPDIEKFVYSVYQDGLFGEWYITFKVKCSDDTSGIDRAEFHINNGLVATDDEEPYEWTYEFSDIFGYVTIKAVVFDQAGNFDYDDYPEFESIPYWSANGLICNPESSQQNIEPSLLPSTESIVAEKRVSTEEQICKTNSDDDTTPPEISVEWEANKIGDKWWVKFIVDAYDEESGVYKVEMFINDGYHEIVIGEGPIYEFTIQWSKAVKTSVFKFVAYNGAGLSAFVTVNGSDIKSYSSSQSSQQSSSIPSSQSTVNVISSTGSMVFNNDTTPPVTTIYFDPAEPDGLNDWYVSNVTVTLNATDDMSGVDTTYYSINSAPWKVYDEPFLLHEDGLYYIVYFSVDNAGNMEFPKLLHLKLDQTPPDIEEVEWETYKEDGIWGIWYCKFTCNAVDETSGMDRVEMYINDGWHEIITSPGPIYEFEIEWMGHFSHWIFTFKHYDVAGNSANDSIDESEITSFPINNNNNNNNNNHLYSISEEVLGGSKGLSLNLIDIPSSQSNNQQSANPLFFQILQRLLTTR